ncbi:cysteine protease staphopain [Staphylococcus simulans]|uniref:cysteine protease staphopain n=1 Tax=Staphylococcus simulans TaxID=1286 RepID=UPI001E4E0610|nr:cysteine protease staphopain [Staphylococcus simulans]MCD8914371.1 cysteine protease staphopain [Staphylococcus simulans]
MNSRTTFIKAASILLLSIILVISGAFSNPDSNNIHAAASASVKIKVNHTEIPYKAEQEAKAHFASYAQALSQIDSSGNHGRFRLGKPFKIYKFDGQEDGNYYYPIMQGNTIHYILTVSPKNTSDVHTDKNQANYSVRVSKFISDALNQYRNGNQPITIYTNKNGYYIEQHQQLKLIKRTTLPNQPTQPDQPAAPKKQLAQTVDTTQTQTETQNYGTKYMNLLPHFKIREQQGYNGWCAGYSMAALLNATKNTSTYNGESIMHQVHPNLTGQQFQFTGLTIQEMIDYGKSQGRNTSYYDGMPSYDVVDQQTKQNKGMVVLGEQVESSQGLHAGHAMAVVGNAELSNSEKVIVIWNPWDQDYTLQPADSNIIPVSNGDHYQWFGSVTGF